VTEVAVVALGALALALEVVAVLGVLVMPDAYDRLHYIGLSTMGGIALGLAVLVQEGPSLIAIKAGLTVLILLTTSPLMTHATARALHARRARSSG
jgi:multicomponent Na+:H+ antiporter subunit G